MRNPLHIEANLEMYPFVRDSDQSYTISIAFEISAEDSQRLDDRLSLVFDIHNGTTLLCAMLVQDPGQRATGSEHFDTEVDNAIRYTSRASNGTQDIPQLRIK